MVPSLAISKANYKDGLIYEVEAYPCTGNVLGSMVNLSRSKIISEQFYRKKIVTIARSATENKWDILNTIGFSYVSGSLFIRPVNDNGVGDTLGRIPRLLPRRKTFISYYHKDDQPYKEKFEWIFGDLVVNKSVDDGDINADNSTDYIKRLIQEGFLADTTIVIVLVSEKTKHRKHVDWEISTGLNYKVGDGYAGLIGLHLPHHVEYGINTYLPSLQPLRLAGNAQRGYAKIYDWRDDRTFMQNIIEDSFWGRTSRIEFLDNSMPQMQRNTCA